MGKGETDTYLEQHVRDDGIYLVNQLEKGIFGQMLQCELPLGHVTRVGFTEDGMTVTRDNLAVFQSRPHVLANGLI